MVYKQIKIFQISPPIVHSTGLTSPLLHSSDRIEIPLYTKPGQPNDCLHASKSLHSPIFASPSTHLKHKGCYKTDDPSQNPSSPYYLQWEPCSHPLRAKTQSHMEHKPDESFANSNLWMGRTRKHPRMILSLTLGRDQIRQLFIKEPILFIKDNFPSTTIFPSNDFPTLYVGEEHY